MPIRIPPALQLLFFSSLMFVVKTQAPFVNFTHGSLPIIAILLTASGLTLIIAGGALFRTHNTTVNPLKPDNASKLVVAGIYRYTRNPMYLGFLLILSAWCIYLGNLLNILFVPCFIYTLSILNIRAEEHALSNKFGEYYSEYCARVRRWI